VYCWSVLPADTSQVPAMMGVALSRERAQQAAGAALQGDGGAFLALVEEARAALAVAGLSEHYQRTGAAWTGRRTRGVVLDVQNADARSRGVIGRGPRNRYPQVVLLPPTGNGSPPGVFFSAGSASSVSLLSAGS